MLLLASGSERYAYLARVYQCFRMREEASHNEGEDLEVLLNAGSKHDLLVFSRQPSDPYTEQ